MNQIDTMNNTKEKTFEDIKHIDEYGNEYWKARELQKALNYSKWENFEKVITNAKEACKNSENDVPSNFPEVRKIVKTGVSTKEIVDYNLSRYACYLIVQNGDPRKEVIALGQTYFAIQTRKQELNEKEYNLLSEEEKIVNENIQGEKNAKVAHNEIGKIVRVAIKQAGGTMPEKLPTPKKSLKELEKEKKRLETSHKLERNKENVK